MSTAERLDELRDLPRVSEEDRKRYKQWEQDLRDDLGAIEDEYAKDAQRERRNSRDAVRCGLVDLPKEAPSREQWRKHWRGLPDYDGGGHAPSGPVFWFFPTGMAPVGGWLCGFKQAQKSDFDPPLRGGRGWCPKLAGAGAEK